jgi:hypothetical protein
VPHLASTAEGAGGGGSQGLNGKVGSGPAWEWVLGGSLSHVPRSDARYIDVYLCMYIYACICMYVCMYTFLFWT